MLRVCMLCPRQHISSKFSSWVRVVQLLGIKMAASTAAFPHSFDLCLHSPILEENSVSSMASICEIPSYEHIVKEEKNILSAMASVCEIPSYENFVKEEKNIVSSMASVCEIPSYENFGKEEKSKILVIGATGYIGRFVALAAVKAGHPTYALIRPITAPDSAKEKCLHELKASGVNIVHGDLSDQKSMVNAMQGIDVVISIVGGAQLTDQLKIVEVIKEIGTIQRFLPSEFGHDIDRANPVEPGLSFYKEKRVVRRAIEEANIPYTYICCNSIAGWPYFYHTHPSELAPPQDQFEIYGDGNIKAYFVTGEDIGMYTIKTLEDVRTVNKSVHFRPPKNFLTLNELAAIWEKKIGKTLPRVCISEQDLLDLAKASKIPESIVASLTHDIFINGCQYNFELEEPKDLEICELYSDIPYATVEDFFDGYL